MENGKRNIAEVLEVRNGLRASERETTELVLNETILNLNSYLRDDSVIWGGERERCNLLKTMCDRLLTTKEMVEMIRKYRGGYWKGVKIESFDDIVGAMGAEYTRSSNDRLVTGRWLTQIEDKREAAKVLAVEAYAWMTNEFLLNNDPQKDYSFGELVFKSIVEQTTISNEHYFRSLKGWCSGKKAEPYELILDQLLAKISKEKGGGKKIITMEDMMEGVVAYYEKKQGPWIEEAGVIRRMNRDEELRTVEMILLYCGQGQLIGQKDHLEVGDYDHWKMLADGFDNRLGVAMVEGLLILNYCQSGRYEEAKRIYKYFKEHFYEVDSDLRLGDTEKRFRGLCKKGIDRPLVEMAETIEKLMDQNGGIGEQILVGRRMEKNANLDEVLAEVQTREESSDY